ncbi:MAG TPA: hypothetical protein VGF16_05125 [Bryobacteraceae bacterium]|jgi:hypothetical protein
MPEYRLGDIIDDYCVRCKRIMNHAVVSVMNNEPAKVRCRTCHSDHDYRHEQAPPPKNDPRKQALFNEVLKRVDPETGKPATAAEGEASAEAPTAEAPAAEAPAAEAPKAKAKGKVRK